MRAQIKIIRAEIFRLAKQSPTLEIMHWYMWVDECFDNNEFHKEDFDNLRWRCNTLRHKYEPIDKLVELITPVLKNVGCVPPS